MHAQDLKLIIHAPDGSSLCLYYAICAQFVQMVNNLLCDTMVYDVHIMA